MFKLTAGLRANAASFCLKLAFACLPMAIAVVFVVAHAQEAVASPAQAYSGGRSARALVVEPINEGKLVTLVGNTPGNATAENDRGAVAGNLQMGHMQLQLQRPPELEQELVSLIAEQQRKGSPEYHHWLTANQFGDRFGVSPLDIEAVSNWLENHGFRVDGVLTSGMVIEFSGTAGQVKQAFHTEIHNLEVDGEAHIANMSDPEIPAALAGVVKGIYALHNFMPHSMLKPRPKFTFDCPAADCGADTTIYAVAPQDLATIYNLNPAFAAGYTGTGQTIVVIEDTNLRYTSDVSTFRSAFGLSGYSGTFSQSNPTGAVTCTNPGVNADEGEAALDAEWSGASAPNAAIELAACADTSTVFGGLIALENLINGATPPPIVSISYGECESANGTTANASYYSTYQQAASEGTTVFVSSGDEGAASCDANKTVATHGIAVSGFASTPYNVAVGGTDFGDLYANLEGGPALSTYWAGTAGNTSALGSALSYVPEVPWNDSCASYLIYTLEGSSSSYGPTGFCNTATGKADFRTTGAGSGGPSTYEVNHKPSWQSVLGNPSDNTRDIPDVSLFAANGVFNHFFVYCMSDTGEGGATCNYTNVSDILDLAAGGTSFSSPIMAGVQALINQSQAGAAQGLVNARLYALGNIEYGATGSAACNSSLGAGVGGSCVFYDVTLGDIDVNCTGTIDCFGTSGSGKSAVDGALSTTVSPAPFSIAYGTNSGWDFATGLGSVNVYNLIQNWDLVQTTTTVTSSTSLLAVGEPVTLTATVTPAIGNTEVGQIAWSSNTGCALSTLSAGVATCITTTLPLGTNTVTATYGGDGTYASGRGSFTQTVIPAPTISSTSSATFAAGVAGLFTVTTTGTPTPALSYSGTLPAGVSFADNGNGTATISGTPAVGTGAAYSLTITANNGTINATQSFTLSVDEAPSITSGNSFSFSIGGVGAYILAASGYPAPTFSETGTLPSGITLTPRGNGQAQLAGRPAANTGGSYPITLTATNGTAPDATQSVTITIKQNVAFTSAATTTFTVGSPGSFSVTTTGYPAPTFSATGSLPSGVSFADNGNGTASLMGTPAAGTGGSYAFTINATNGFSTPSQSFTLIVDQAPAISSANSTTFTGAVAGSFSVTATGYPTSALSESGALPSGITFTDNGNGTGSLAGTTAAPGTFPILITANNGVSPNAVQSFTLTVTPPLEQLTTTAYPATGGTITPASGSIFTQGTVVPLVATPAAGYTFAGWTSAADPVGSATSASTTIAVNGPESVTAQFAPNLVVNTNGDTTLGAAGDCSPQAAPGVNLADASCSLRDALAFAANAGAGNISFDGTTFKASNSVAANTITLSSTGTLNIPTLTSITGPTTGSGATLANLVTVAGGGSSSNFAVFSVNSSAASASIANLVISGGNTTSGTGGGIVTGYQSALTVANSTISGNAASPGAGGIFNDYNATLTVIGSTISGNTGAGIVNESGGTVTVTSSTISGNSGSGIANGGTAVTIVASTITGNSGGYNGGGINSSAGTVTLANTILAGNIATTSPDINGAYTDNGGNVVGGVNGVSAANVNLGALGSYGGPMQTIVPLPGSPAICGGLAAQVPAGVTTDERGDPNMNIAYPGYSAGSPCVDAGAVQTNYALAFTTEPPSTGTAGSVIAPAPVVALTESGAAATLAAGALTMTDSAGVLAGITTANLSAGSASFSGLIVPTAESSDVLTANLTLNAALSTPLSLAVPASTTLAVAQTAYAVLYAPAVGTALGTSNVTFAWTAGVGESRYSLLVGIAGPGSSDLFSQTSATATSATVATLPAYTGTIYVRLMSLTGNTWHTTDYTFSEGLSAATLTSPTAGSSLGTSNVTFTWSAGVGVSKYSLLVGAGGPGSSSIYSLNSTTATRTTLATLPAYTGTIYVRLMSLIGSTWHSTDYTFSEGLSAAALTLPTAGSPLGTSNVTFTWSAGVGVSKYTLLIGISGPGSSNIYNLSSTTETTTTLATLPTYTGTIYVRLMSYIAGAWSTTDYTFTEGLSPATLTLPTAGSSLGTSNVTFTWSGGVGVSKYTLLVGISGPGSSNIYNLSSTTATTTTLATLPAYTGTIYVRLMSYIGSTWYTTDYTFSEGLSAAALTLPTAGSSLGTSNVTFTWSAGVGVSKYTLLIGISGPGSSNLYNLSSTTATTTTLATLPAYSGTIYVRLMSYIGNTWYTTDYTFSE